MSAHHQVYARYLNDVAAVCDNNMQEAPMAWRDPFYITDLNKVLAMFLEIDKSQQTAARISLYVQRTPISPKRRLCRPTWSKSLEKKSALIESTSSSSIGNVEDSPVSSHRAVAESSTDSPDSIFSPLSLPSPLSSSTDTSSCKVCGQVFRGLLQYRIGCDSTFNRQDNLNKHIRKTHPRLGLLRRRRLTKRRRSSARG